MTSCFTNKRTNGKLTRYYYYRCTSTMKQDWQSCSVKQVSAERLENFCLENLERISVDKNYIENLVFRLNNDSQLPRRAGYELTDSCSKFSQFSAEKIAGTLNFFISALKNSKRIERNLLAKRFLEKIAYAPESIKISLFASQNPQDFGGENYPAPQTRGGAKQSLPENENPTFLENRKFAMLSMAPGAGFEPATNRLTGDRSTAELSRNMV